MITNTIGEILLKSLVSKGGAELSEIDTKRLVQSQTGMLYEKKKTLIARSNLLHKSTIEHNYILNPDIIDYLFAIYRQLNLLLMSKDFLCRMLKHIPLQLLRLYKMTVNTIPLIQMKRLIRNRY